MSQPARSLTLSHLLPLLLPVRSYVCAEWDYGGIPAWLAYKPDMRFRAYNQPWMDAVQSWVGRVINETRQYFADQGGPIVLAQIENELQDSADPRYVAWSGDMANAFGVNVPWVRRHRSTSLSDAQRLTLCSPSSDGIRVCCCAPASDHVQRRGGQQHHQHVQRQRLRGLPHEPRGSRAASSWTSRRCGRRTRAGSSRGSRTPRTRAPTRTARQRRSPTRSCAGSLGAAAT